MSIYSPAPGYRSDRVGWGVVVVVGVLVGDAVTGTCVEGGGVGVCSGVLGVEQPAPSSTMVSINQRVIRFFIGVSPRR